MPDQGVFNIVVDNHDNDKRLDLFVSSQIPGCSRKLVSSLIKNGTILVHESKKKPGYRVKTGDIIEGYIPCPAPSSFEPEPVAIDIIHEDQNIIVVNKPPGMVVHPAPGNYSGTLVNGLLFHCPDLKGIGGELRPGIVHRLDKGTSGVIVVAKDHDSHTTLSSQFKSRKISKKYLAIVYGAPKEDSGTITFPIGRHPTDRKKMSIHSKKPRTAETTWTVTKRFGGLSMLELCIKTGRTHQIRVHCSAINHHVVGDPLYRVRKPGKNFKGHTDIHNLIKSLSRQMLHAWQIGFIHPSTGKLLKFEAPIPDDMKNVIDGIKDLMNKS